MDARDRRHTQETDSIDETLKGVNTFNMLKGVQGGYMSSTQQHRRDTDRHTQTHEIDAQGWTHETNNADRMHETLKGVNRR